MVAIIAFLQAGGGALGFNAESWDRLGLDANEIAAILRSLLAFMNTSIEHRIGSYRFNIISGSLLAVAVADTMSATVVAGSEAAGLSSSDATVLAWMVYWDLRSRLQHAIDAQDARIRAELAMFARVFTIHDVANKPGEAQVAMIPAVSTLVSQWELAPRLSPWISREGATAAPFSLSEIAVDTKIVAFVLFHSIGVDAVTQRPFAGFMAVYIEDSRSFMPVLDPPCDSDQYMELVQIALAARPSTTITGDDRPPSVVIVARASSKYHLTTIAHVSRFSCSIVVSALDEPQLRGGATMSRDVLLREMQSLTARATDALRSVAPAVSAQ
jgi:hypothetical protein